VFFDAAETPCPDDGEAWEEKDKSLYAITAYGHPARRKRDSSLRRLRSEWRVGGRIGWDVGWEKRHTRLRECGTRYPALTKAAAVGR